MEPPLLVPLEQLRGQPPPAQKAQVRAQTLLLTLVLLRWQPLSMQQAKYLEPTLLVPLMQPRADAIVEAPQRAQT